MPNAAPSAPANPFAGQPTPTGGVFAGVNFNNTNWANYPGFFPNTAGVGYGAALPAYPRVSAIPSWLPSEGGSQLQTELEEVPSAFSTSGFDKASEDQQSRVLTTALDAGNNAATEYANKARQQGGSGMGAGLIKAEAGVAGENTAGQIALQRAQFDASQREKAATLSSQIANNLGNLRDSYIKTLTNYATSEDSISENYYSKMLGGPGSSTTAHPGPESVIGGGIGHENDFLTFGPGGNINTGTNSFQNQPNQLPSWLTTGRG